jgi:hypothetical protein
LLQTVLYFLYILFHQVAYLVLVSHYVILNSLFQAAYSIVVSCLCNMANLFHLCMYNIFLKSLNPILCYNNRPSIYKVTYMVKPCEWSPLHLSCWKPSILLRKGWLWPQVISSFGTEITYLKTFISLLMTLNSNSVNPQALTAWGIVNNPVLQVTGFLTLCRYKVYNWDKQM